MCFQAFCPWFCDLSKYNQSALMLLLLISYMSLIQCFFSVCFVTAAVFLYLFGIWTCSEQKMFVEFIYLYWMPIEYWHTLIWSDLKSVQCFCSDGFNKTGNWKQHIMKINVCVFVSIRKHLIHFDIKLRVKWKLFLCSRST